MTFAREEHVEKMRKLLLDYRADESEKERKTWVTNQHAALFERIRIREPREDMYDGCAAAMDMNMGRTMP